MTCVFYGPPMPTGEADSQRFAQELAALIDERDMTVPELARMSGLNDQTVRNYLSGVRVPRLPNLRQLEIALQDTDARLRQALGVRVPTNHSERLATGPTRDEQADSPLRLSASGTALDELSELDPEGYEAIVQQAEFLLRRARERRS